jgi:hypothetical protein
MSDPVTVMKRILVLREELTSELHGYRCLGGVKVKFTLEQATKVQRGSRGIVLLVL